ncbi:MAG TPA: hypothetical protein VJG64_00815 [Candidatus Paceibacterota bacterium]
MSKATIARVIHHGNALLTAADRAAILRRARGAWKHRSLKGDVRTLSTIRRSWNRKIG